MKVEKRTNYSAVTVSFTAEEVAEVLGGANSIVDDSDLIERKMSDAHYTVKRIMIELTIDEAEEFCLQASLIKANTITNMANEIRKEVDK